MRAIAAERLSWLVETVQSSSDGFKTIDQPADAGGGSTGFEIEDYLVKLQLDSDPTADRYQSLRVKVGRTDQVSDETYLGLTEEDFAQDPNRRYAASKGDIFNGDHEQYQLSYVVDSGAAWRGEVTAYRNDFARDWFKLQSVDGVGISDILDEPLTNATALQLRHRHHESGRRNHQATQRANLLLAGCAGLADLGLRPR